MTEAALTADEYEQLVVRDAFGDSTEDERGTLESDLHRWKAALITLTQGAQETLSRMKAEEAAISASGRMPLSEWNNLTAEIRAKRGKTLSFKRHTEARLRDVNLLIRQEGQRQYEYQRTTHWRRYALSLLDQFAEDDRPTDADFDVELVETHHFALRLLAEQDQSHQPAIAAG